LRSIATGRKAWLFCGSDDHAAAANLFSLIAKLHSLDAETYLRDVIRVIALLAHGPLSRARSQVLGRDPSAPRSRRPRSRGWPARRADREPGRVAVHALIPSPSTHLRAIRKARREQGSCIAYPVGRSKGTGLRVQFVMFLAGSWFRCVTTRYRTRPDITLRLVWVVTRPLWKKYARKGGFLRSVAQPRFNTLMPSAVAKQLVLRRNIREI